MLADLQRYPRFGMGCGHTDQRADQALERPHLWRHAKQLPGRVVEPLAHGVALRFDMLSRRATTRLADRLAGVAVAPGAAWRSHDWAAIGTDGADDRHLGPQQQYVDIAGGPFAGGEAQQQRGRLGSTQRLDARAQIERQSPQ